MFPAPAGSLDAPQVSVKYGDLNVTNPQSPNVSGTGANLVTMACPILR